MPASETPPAVPLEAVDTAALPAPPPAAPKAPAAPEATEAPALSATGVEAAGAASGAPDGLMAEAAKDLSAPAPAEAAQAPAADPAKGQAKLPPKPLPKPAPEAAPAAAPAAVADAEPAPAADAAVAMVLHLSSLRSEEAAKREWSDLQRSFPEPLGQMQAEFRRTELGDKGTYYRVLAGPLPSRDAARQVCDDLKAKKARQYCRIVPSQPQAQPQS
ncbi:MAG: SPOR domain-containing protein [Kiloniellaceae bacterium]